MIKAVLSSSNGTNPPLNSVNNLTFKSNTLEGSDSKTYETRIEQSRPFFKDPFAEKLSGLERTLHAIMVGKMNDDQKLVLYKNSLNDIFVTDRMRKLSARKPERRERAAPPAQVPQPAAVAALPVQAPAPAQLGAIPKRLKKKKKKKTHRSQDLGKIPNKYKTARLLKIARRHRELEEEEEEGEDPPEAAGGEPPPRRPRLPPSPARRRRTKRRLDDPFPAYPAARTRSKAPRNV